MALSYHGSWKKGLFFHRVWSSHALRMSVLTEFDWVKHILVNYDWDLGHEVDLIRNVTVSRFRKIVQRSNLRQNVRVSRSTAAPVGIICMAPTSEMVHPLSVKCEVPILEAVPQHEHASLQSVVPSVLVQTENIHAFSRNNCFHIVRKYLYRTKVSGKYVVSFWIITTGCPTCLSWLFAQNLFVQRCC